ncbi:MAG TPA: hypothetical protein VFR05_06745, partial [Terriglobia bacterium]|nr:hypothetical protein [Terriglobia bacterium]
VHEGLDRAALIYPEERDHYLRLESGDWGRDLRSDRWERKPKPRLHYRRSFPVHVDPRNRSTELEELIVPFPSAPIYGINRKAEYGKPLEHRPNLHSLRLLRRPKGAPVHRLFILHNGLNEADDLKFYYRLADWIMGQQEAISDKEGVACLVMPFPGHLMHSSFHGPFSETPLSRYLSDAGDLFRQFLKYMVGMRWLLSIVADSDAEDWMVGGELLERKSRIEELTKESESLYEMSAKRIARTEELGQDHDGAPDAGGMDGDSNGDPAFDLGEKTQKSQVAHADALLRKALGRTLSELPTACGCMSSATASVGS